MILVYPKTALIILTHENGKMPPIKFEYQLQSTLNGYMV